MNKNPNELPDEFHGIAKRLKDERPQATDLELDRVKVRALSGGSRFGNRTVVRSGRIASVAVAAVLLIGGGVVIAKQDPPQAASSQSSSSSTQYCPPPSQQPGKPKDPGPSKCGSPKSK
jgi:hypothetical protein